VVRGGYGIYYDSLIFNGLESGRTAPPPITQVRSAASREEHPRQPPGRHSSTSDNFGCPGRKLQQCHKPGNVVSENPHVRNPYEQQYSLGVEVRLAASVMAELSYVGSRGSPSPPTSPSTRRCRRTVPLRLPALPIKPIGSHSSRRFMLPRMGRETRASILASTTLVISAIPEVPRTTRCKLLCRKV